MYILHLWFMYIYIVPLYYGYIMGVYIPLINGTVLVVTLKTHCIPMISGSPSSEKHPRVPKESTQYVRWSQAGGSSHGVM